MLDNATSLRIITTMVHEFGEDDHDAIVVEYASLLYYAGQQNNFLADYAKFREEMSIVAANALEKME